MRVVNGGFFPGFYHPFPTGTNVVASRTIVSSAIGGGPSRGSYSSAQYSQTVSSPHQIHTSVSTHHPLIYSTRQNHGQRSNPGYSGHGHEYSGSSRENQHHSEHGHSSVDTSSSEHSQRHSTSS